MSDENVLNYIKELSKDVEECLAGWRTTEQYRLLNLGRRPTNEEMISLSSVLTNHPLLSILNKLNRDHQSICDGGAIKPPSLSEFLPQHYSLSFPVIQKWSSEYPTEIPLPVTHMPGLPAQAGPLSFAGHAWTEDELEKFKIVMDSATNPDQSGYVRMKLGDNGKPIFEPITKEEFYKKTAVEMAEYIENHVKVIKEGEKGYGKYRYKVLSPFSGFPTHHTNEKDDAICWLKRYHSHDPEADEKEQKIKDGIIERGGE